MERHGAVRIRDQFGREVNFTSWGEEPPRGAFPGGGRGRGNGGGGGKQGKAIWNEWSRGEVDGARQARVAELLPLKSR